MDEKFHLLLFSTMELCQQLKTVIFKATSFCTKPKCTYMTEKHLKLVWGVKTWTDISEQNKTWAKFSTLDMGGHVYATQLHSWGQCYKTIYCSNLLRFHGNTLILCFKMILLLWEKRCFQNKSKFITDEYFSKHINIKTKLKH